MKIKYFSPSYRRGNVRSNTQLNYPFVKLVVAESEAKQYRESGNEVVTMPDPVQGNISRVRNWMLDNLMKRCDCLVMMDDDVSGIYKWQNLETSKLSAEALEEFCENGALMAKDMGVYYWGINPITDIRNYSPGNPFSTLFFIGGPFTAVMRGTKLRYDERLSLKEDYDYTLQNIWKYGRVLRFNMLHYECKQAEQGGGCAVYRTTLEERKQVDLLRNKWGADVLRYDKQSKREFDFNLLLRVPIKGV